MEWSRDYSPEEVRQLEQEARAHHEMLGGLSTWADECSEAATALDARRREHERRFRRTRVAARPATREDMVRFIESVGATDVTASPDLIHVPVAPVADGIAFAPRRMTVSNLEEVYMRLKGVAPAEGKVLDRVKKVIETYPTGLRKADIVAHVDANERSVRRALEMMELHQEVVVRLEPTRPGGSQRKRYFPANTVFSDVPEVDSIDPALTMGVL